MIGPGVASSSTSYFVAGSSMVIQWTSANLPIASNVGIYLSHCNSSLFWCDGSPSTTISTLKITATASNTGAYVWQIPTGNSAVTGSQFYIFLNESSYNAASPQFLFFNIWTGILNGVMFSSGSPRIGESITLQWNYLAPPDGTLLITLYRSATGFVTNLTSDWPVQYAYTWVPDGSLSTSYNDYYIVIRLLQDYSHVVNSTLTFSILPETGAPIDIMAYLLSEHRVLIYRFSFLQLSIATSRSGVRTQSVMQAVVEGLITALATLPFIRAHWGHRARA